MILSFSIFATLLQVHNAIDFTGIAIDGFTGEIITQNSSDYSSSDWMVWQSWSYPFINATAIYYAQNSNDVVLFISFVKNNAYSFRVRSSGSSFGGYSTCEGCMILDVSNLDQVEYFINPKITGNDFEVIASIEPGVTSPVMIKSFHNNSITNSSLRILHPTGCAGVTAGGFYQNGAVTKNIEQYGYASDYIIGVQIVLSDGKLKTFWDRNHKKHKKDILWAIRGSGGANFGVILKYYMKTIPLEDPNNILKWRMTFKFDSKSGVDLMKAAHKFVEIKPISSHSVYYIDSITSPQDVAKYPTGFYIDFSGTFFVQNKDKFNVHDMVRLINETIIQYSKNTIDALVTYTMIFPPIQYNVANFAGTNQGQISGLPTTRLVLHSKDLTDQFYQDIVDFYANNLFIGSDPNLFVNYGIGTHAIIELWGHNTNLYHNDPDNKRTSAPNRDSFGKFSIIIGIRDTKLFGFLKNMFLDDLRNEANDILSQLSSQNYVGYRDAYLSDINYYFGGKKNQKILRKLQYLKCKYDNNNLFYSWIVPDCSKQYLNDNQVSPLKGTSVLIGMLFGLAAAVFFCAQSVWRYHQRKDYAPIGNKNKLPVSLNIFNNNSDKKHVMHPSVI